MPFWIHRLRHRSWRPQCTGGHCCDDSDNKTLKYQGFGYGGRTSPQLFCRHNLELRRTSLFDLNLFLEMYWIYKVCGVWCIFTGISSFRWDGEHSFEKDFFKGGWHIHEAREWSSVLAHVWELFALRCFCLLLRSGEYDCFTRLTVSRAKNLVQEATESASDRPSGHRLKSGTNAVDSTPSAKYVFLVFFLDMNCFPYFAISWYIVSFEGTPRSPPHLFLAPTLSHHQLRGSGVLPRCGSLYASCRVLFSRRSDPVTFIL